MILEQLTLRNFGVFRGQQVFELAPPPQAKNGAGRPIVLFGGTNGVGKTTILDGLQLALYGARARCSNRVGLGYDAYLRQSIHHGVAPSEGAGVAVSFRYTEGGDPHLIEVCRSWNVQAGKVREVVQVFQDGIADRWHTEHWAQKVEEFFPLDVAQLFFFDAEKIRSLAEDETSSQALGTAVKSLLGLDVAERLIADSTVLHARLVKQTGTPKERTDVQALERQIEEIQVRLDALQLDRAALQNQRLRAEADQKKAEEAFAATGGKHFEAKQQRERRAEEVEKRFAEAESELVVLASGELPLALVGDLLERVERQDEVERESAAAELVNTLLRERDAKLAKQLKRESVPAATLRLINDALTADRKAREAAQGEPPRLELSTTARSHVHHLRNGRLKEVQAKTKATVTALKKLGLERDDIGRAVAVTPDEDDMAKLLERLRAADAKFNSLKAQAAARKVEFESLKDEHKRCVDKLKAVRTGEVHEEFERDDQKRMIRLTARTRDTMQVFLARATERKIERLSDLITESFRYLLQKQTMVARIAIDPETFAITLFDDAGHALPKHRLSEGEKQIFAISVLWGLGRASARPLPAVIDTPMARLDAANRRNLVERYFPHASHQVVILSTDTEVDARAYQSLQSHIARAYHLHYDETTRSTCGELGYFWTDGSARPGGDLRSLKGRGQETRAQH